MKCSYFCILNNILSLTIYVTHIFGYCSLHNQSNLIKSRGKCVNNGFNAKNRSFDLSATDNDLFVDTCKIIVKAGDGGDGCLSFRREKHVPLGGPSGGSGGHGGNVYLLGDKSLSNLYQLKLQTYFRASNGQNGRGSQRRGVKGKDIEIRIPLGTLVYDDSSHFVGEITHHNQKICVARGGRGGRGNFCFKTNKNSAPHVSEKGELGVTRTLNFTFKILGDVGLVGLPNSGKSLLLSRVTNANPRVAPFPFCTTKPNLGVYLSEDIKDDQLLNKIDSNAIDIDDTNSLNDEGSKANENELLSVNIKEDNKNYRMVIADIPGIILDAHKGKGLGLDFLKHIQKCHILVHIIDASSQDPIHDYQVITNELKCYDPQLLDKVQMILLNKSDLVPLKEMLLMVDRFKETCSNEHVYSVSALTSSNLHEVFDIIFKKRTECVMDSEKIKQEISNNDQNNANELNYFSEIDDFTKYNPKDYQIEKVSDGIYRLRGKYLERKVGMMNLDQYESVVWLNRLLDKHRVMDTIRKCGAKPNEVLLIGKYEFTIPKF